MNEELKVLITAEINKLKQGVDNAKKHITGFKDQVKKASKDVEKNFAAMGTGISEGLKKGIDLAVKAFAGLNLAIGAAVIGTQEYRNNQAKLKTAFEDAGGSAATATKTYNDLYRVLGDDGAATEAAQQLGKLTTNQENLSEWTRIAQGAYSVFGETLPISSLAEAANETAKSGVLTGALTDSLVWCGVAEEEFQAKLDACNTEAEREQLIRETLNGLYGEAADKYEKNNSKVLAQNEANARLTATMASLGDKMAPVITAFTNFASSALAVVEPYISNLTANLLPVLQELLDGIVSALEVGLEWITQHSEALGIIAGVIGGLVAAIGLYNGVAAIKAAMDAAQVTTLWGLVSAYAAQAAAMIVAIAPYVLIVAAIAAVVAAIVWCVQNWDMIKEKVVEVWGVMTEWISEKAAFVEEKVKAMVEGVKKWFGDMKETMSNAVNGAKEDTQKALSNMKSAYEENGGGIKGIVSATMEGVRGLFQTGYNFINTLTGGKFGEIVNKISGKLSEAKTKVSEILNSVKKAFTDKFEAAKKVVSDALAAITGFFTNIEWSLPKIPMPHFNVTGKLDLLVWPPQVPSLTVDWYAKGGVFDKPTLFGYGNGNIGGLGEAGAEAIVPLERTEWVDKIAERMVKKQGNTPIVLQVDGKVFAQTSIEAINNLTRQSGRLGLNLV